MQDTTWSRSLEMRSSNLSFDSKCHRSRNHGRAWMVTILLFSLILGGIPISIADRTPLLLYFDMVLGLFLFTIAVRRTRSQEGLPFWDKKLFFLCLAYLCAQCVSLLVNGTDALRGILAMKVTLFGSLTYFVTLHVTRTERALKHVIYGLVLLGSTLSALLVYYFLTEWRFNLDTDISYTIFKDLIGLEVGRSNYLASMLVLILPVSTALFASARGLFRFVLLLATGVILAGMMITMSRGAYISIAVALLVSCPVVYKAGFRVRHLVGVFIFAALLYVLLPRELIDINSKGIVDRWMNPDYSRVEMMKVAWNVFAEHPVVGVGANNMYLYNYKYGGMYSLHTHNFVFGALGELGLLGAVPFLSMIGIVLIRSFKLCGSSLLCRADQRLASGFFIGLMASMIHGLMEPTFAGQQYAVVFWVYAAAVFVMGRLAELTSRSAGLQRGRAATRKVAISWM